MSRIALPGEPSYGPLDRYSILHILSGVVMGMTEMKPSSAFAVGALWEVAERPLKEFVPKAFPLATQETLTNSIFDVVCVMAGFAATRLARGRTSSILTFRRLP